jgi:hypothetical protein
LIRHDRVNTAGPSLGGEDGGLRAIRSGRATAAGELGTFAGFLEAKSHSDDLESIVDRYDRVSGAIRRLAAIAVELQTRGGRRASSGERTRRGF